MKTEFLGNAPHLARLQQTYRDILDRALRANTVHDDEVHALGRLLVRTAFPIKDLLALHERVLDDANGELRDPISAGRVLDGVLDMYDGALAGFQELKTKLQSEVLERRRIQDALKDANEELTEQRTFLEAEVQMQTRKLSTSNLELTALNNSITTRRDEMASFLFAVSHDLKSPLNTIRMQLSFFIEDNEDRQINFEDLRSADETAARMSQMLDDLLEFSRTIDDDHMRSEVDLVGLVQGIVQDLGGDTLEARIETESLPVVHGSEFQLRLLFQNLISNALKFRHPSRPPEVLIRSVNILSHRRACIEVSDNGIGMDPKFHDRIFELFKRLHTDTEYEGSGIGLATCKRIVDNHGGKISVRSEQGRGTAFQIELPQ